MPRSTTRPVKPFDGDQSASAAGEISGLELYSSINQAILKVKFAQCRDFMTTPCLLSLANFDYRVLIESTPRSWPCSRAAAALVLLLPPRTAAKYKCTIAVRIVAISAILSPSRHLQWTFVPLFDNFFLRRIQSRPKGQSRSMSQMYTNMSNSQRRQ
ncbi:uncharacterized protein BKA78DRAFT_128683 [Phyllosticta capitalensis]|uniref:uncharacterized protein n=1 Tax=Phyllosticta capitalensis TaxID=121624 RepID=UPI00312D7CA9